MGQQSDRALPELFSSIDHPMSHELLKSFIHNTSDGCVLLDLNHNVLVVNSPYEVMYGWTSAELLGKQLQTTPRQLLEETRSIHEKVLAGARVNGYEMFNLRKDGSVVNISVTVTPLTDRGGRIVAILRLEREIFESRIARQTTLDMESDALKLLNHTLEPVIVYTNNKIKYVNAAALNFIGANHIEDLINTSIFEIFPLLLIKDLVKNGYPTEMMQSTLIRVDQRVIDIEVKAMAIRYLGLPSVQLVCRDVSKHKMIETSLSEAENLYRNLVENSIIGIYLSQDGRAIYTNNSLPNMFGYSSQEFLQLHAKELVLEEDWLELVEGARKNLIGNNSKFHFQVRGKKKDKRIVYLEGSAILITHNGKPTIFVTLNDVTYKHEKEHLLIEYAQSYQNIVELLPEPIILKVDGIIIYANLSARKMIKASDEQEIIGRSAYDIIHPQCHESMRIMMDKVLLSDEPQRFQEQTLICMDGEVIDVEISSIRIHNFMDKVATLTVIRDLSERKRTEESLIQSEKLSVIGQLAAGVAHEIRNPLTAIRGFCQLLKRRFGDQITYLDIMLNELDRINLIVNEFMTLAKPHITHFAEQSVNEILRSVFAILEAQATLLNVNIDTLLDESIPDVYCDENQLKQVFINIIKNAIEAMPHGGNVTINTLINIEGNICIQVIDQGKGIPGEILGKIGGPFFTTKESGTGLGLMICQQIINAHQGFIYITSELEQGTTVEIVLPCSDNS